MDIARPGSNSDLASRAKFSHVINYQAEHIVCNFLNAQSNNEFDLIA